MKFEFGELAIRRNSATDWDGVWRSVVAGNIDEIPADIRIRYYFPLRAIQSDYIQPSFQERTCVVYWGKTGVGKSRRAWDEAGMGAYPKDPRTKFWCGYRGECNIVIDEFRGGIDISHVLRWLDRYPVRVEIKGGSRILSADRYWITSNIHPREWYPELDSETLDALLRRMVVTQLIQPFE